MKLIFDWCFSFHEEKKSWRGDAKIISLEIVHRECGFASAKVVVTTTEPLVTKKYAKIAVQKDDQNVEIIFSGRLVSFPIGFGNSCLKLEFISEPEDYQNQLNNFCQLNYEQYKNIDKHKLSDHPIIFDDLFFSTKDMNNPTVFLEGDCKIFYWDMTNGKLSLSDINHGAKNFEIKKCDIMQNSLKVRLFREPYKSISISIETSWLRHAYGCINLYPLIASNFKNSVVSSYTNIGTAMENFCKFSKNTGYELISSKIKEIYPTQNRHFFQNFSPVSAEYAIEKNEISPQKFVRFKKFYFKGQILVNWHHKQKINENITIKVINTKSNGGREKNINLKLGPLQLPKAQRKWHSFWDYNRGEKVLHSGQIFECLAAHVAEDKFDEKKWRLLEKIPDALPDETASSFFATDRGKNAIRYAVQKAIALIKYSSRYVELNFNVYAKNFINVTLNDQITVIDDRFSGGSISGKVTKTAFFADCNHRIFNITICCNLGGFAEISTEKINEYFQKLSINNEEEKINSQDIVTKISVENSPEEQEAQLAKIRAKSVAELKAELRRYPTKIKVVLHPLSTTKAIRKNHPIPDFLV
ncbi:MAG: hypothetical protein LBT70_00835 [Holosporaceae bacterium]|jgi:hypothetical protein|nr:hypothetical protein [Holosporaceae bacterium]